MKDKIYGRRLGGLNRSEASRAYLFSGLMSCGLCGGKFNVIIGGAPSKVRYGCTNHRFRDACTNKTTILRVRLEQQLIAVISKNLLDPRLEQQRIRNFSAQLKATIALEEELASEVTSNPLKLKAERSELEKQAGHLVDAMAQLGCSPLLSSQLAKVESRIAEIDRLLTVKSAPKLPAFTDRADTQIYEKGMQRLLRATICRPVEGTPRNPKSYQEPDIDAKGNTRWIGVRNFWRCIATPSRQCTGRA